MKREEHKYKHLKKFHTIHYDIYKNDDSAHRGDEDDTFK